MIESKEIRSSKPLSSLSDLQPQVLSVIKDIKEKLESNNASIYFSVIKNLLPSELDQTSGRLHRKNASIADYKNIFALSQIAVSGITADNMEKALTLILLLYKEEVLDNVIRTLNECTKSLPKNTKRLSVRSQKLQPTIHDTAVTSEEKTLLQSTIHDTAVTSEEETFIPADYLTAVPSAEVSTAASSAVVPPVAPVKVSPSVVPATASSAVVSKAASSAVVSPVAPETASSAEVSTAASSAVVSKAASSSEVSPVVPVAPAIPEEITDLCDSLAEIDEKPQTLEDPQTLLKKISRFKGKELVGNLGSDSLRKIYSTIFDIFKRNPDTKIHMLYHRSGYETHLEINGILMPDPDYVGRRLHEQKQNIFKDAGIIELLENNPQIRAIVAPMATKTDRDGTNSHFVSKIIERDDVNNPINLDSVGYTWNPANGGSDVLDSIETLLAIMYSLEIHRYDKKEEEIKTTTYLIDPNTFSWKSIIDLKDMKFFPHTYEILTSEQQAALYQKFISLDHISCLSDAYNKQLNQIVLSKPLQITKNISKSAQSVLLPIYDEFIQNYNVQNQQNKEYGFYNFLIFLLKLQMQNGSVPESDALHYLSVLAEQIEHFKDLTRTDFKIICNFLDCKPEAIKNNNFFEVMFYFASILPIIKNNNKEFYDSLKKAIETAELGTQTFGQLILERDSVNKLREINSDLDTVWRTNTQSIVKGVLSNSNNYESILDNFKILATRLFQQQVRRNIGGQSLKCSNRSGIKPSPVSSIAPASEYSLNEIYRDMFTLLWKILTENNIEFDNKEVLPTIVQAAIDTIKLSKQIPPKNQNKVCQIGTIFAMLICEYNHKDTTKERKSEIINILRAYNTDQLLELENELSKYMKTKFPSITDPVIVDVETHKTMPSISNVLKTLMYYPNYSNILQAISVFLIAQKQDGKGFLEKLRDYSVKNIMQDPEFQEELLQIFFEVCIESDRSGLIDPVNAIPLPPTEKAKQILKYLTNAPDVNMGVIQHSLPKYTKNLLDNIVDGCASRPAIPNFSQTTIDGFKHKFKSLSTQEQFNDPTLQTIRNKINQSSFRKLLEIEKGQTKQNLR